MRLLAISALADVAGGEVTLLRVLPRLQARGVSVRLALPGKGRLWDAACAQGIATVRVPLGPPERRTAAALAGAGVAVRHALRSDVAWLNGLPAQRAVPALLLTGRRALLRVNNPLEQTPAAWGRPGFWHAVAAVIADSGDTARQCIAVGAPADRVHVLMPPAWGETRPRPAAPPPDGRPLRVGFVGRIEPRKGVLELVQSARSFLAGRPQATLSVIGEPPPHHDGAYLARVQTAVAQSGAAERIELRGYVPDAAWEIGQFDVLAVPSLAEPFGTVAAEAAAAGVPVVASRTGGLEEVVGEGGVLVAPGDRDALAAAIGELLDDPARRRALASAALRASGRFDPERFAERVDELLRAAASRHR